jgi:hypothetical protein
MIRPRFEPSSTFKSAARPYCDRAGSEARTRAVYLPSPLRTRNHCPQLGRILALRAVRIDCSVDVVISETALNRAIDVLGACIQNRGQLGVRAA